MFTLRGKTSVDTSDLSPKEATAMSRDIKYIGMDVHKEAIVIDKATMQTEVNID
jgi:hypothetical protein